MSRQAQVPAREVGKKGKQRGRGRGRGWEGKGAAGEPGAFGEEGA